MSSPDRHRRVVDLFLAACDCPEAERPGLLQAECGSDVEMLHEVQRMLKADADLANSENRRV